MSGHPAAVADALVVGGGPAGAAAAHQIAAAGHRVLIADLGGTPAEKACGGLVTPRGVSALRALGLDRQLGEFHRIDRVRLTEGASTASTPWPSHRDHPDHALVVSRTRLDRMVVDRAITAGATLLDRHQATEPIVERGFVRGAHIIAPGGESFELRAGLTVVADGANSRFGRSLGTFRQPTWPSALAHRAVYRSPLHESTEAELVLAIHDTAGTRITGYGWMFPRGDGTVSVGVLMMSTSPSFRVVNPAHLLQRFVAEHAARWSLEPEPVEAPAGGRIPLGSSVGPTAGPTYLVVGDAAAAANPMTGAGIEYALETGMLAGDVVDDAISTGTASSLQRYPQLLDDRYGDYYKVGRLANRLLGRPAVARRVSRLAASRQGRATAFVRLTANELRTGRNGAAEGALRLGRALSVIAPDA